MASAQHLLDQVQSPDRIDALAAEPGAYAACLAEELGAAGAVGDDVTLDGLDAVDAQLRRALGQIDAMIERAARIRLEHALAGDPAIGAPTRRVFASTIASYAGRIELLEARVADAAARGGAANPGDVAARAGDAVRSVLALRDAVRAGVLAVIRERAGDAAPFADRRARDRTLDESVRKRWSAARRDLEAIASQPEAIAAAAMAARLAAWPEQLDEPAQDREPTFADMIELD
jgi:hypothetical protein